MTMLILHFPPEIALLSLEIWQFSYFIVAVPVHRYTGTFLPKIPVLKNVPVHRTVQSLLR